MNCEFSLSHYNDILRLMVGKGGAGTATERKNIILTHDIDIFPAYALQMARMEHLYGIRAIYYVLLHSEWYNAVSPENMDIWRQISELGHEIALHYDGRYDSQLETIHKAFCAWFNTESINVSQHLIGITPDMVIPDSLQDRSSLLKEYRYIADSGGWWRNGCICKHLENQEKLLFVCHPIWWCKGQNPFGAAAVDAFNVTKRAMQKWESLVNEHREQQKVSITARSA